MKNVIRDEEFFIIIKWSERHNSTCAWPNNRALKYMKQKLTELKGEMCDSVILLFGEF